MTDQATLETWLAEAEAALHKLATGSLRQTVDVGEKRVTYTPADLGQLRRHVADLKNRIAALKGRPKRGPLYMEF